jgi:hypothetical protein
MNITSLQVAEVWESDPVSTLGFFTTGVKMASAGPHFRP